MDSKQKVVIVALAAVVILFVVALAVQSGGEEGDASSIGSGPGGLLGSFGGSPAAVPASELTGSCGRQASTIRVEGSCELRVRPSEDRMRLVRLRTNDEIDVTAPAPGDADFDIDKELDAGQEVSVAVDAGGAEIHLGCGFGKTCTLVVLEADS
jgi:hypothetical protein